MTKQLVSISKEESLAIRKALPKVHIAVVNRCKKSKQKSYYMEESKAALSLLKNLRK